MFPDSYSKRKMNGIVAYMILILLFSLSACHPENTEIRLQAGDLLFRGAASGNLAEAIDRVNQTEAETHFSHIGIVEQAGDSIFVLHADPKGGTCRILLQEFLHPENDSVNAAAYRLKIGRAHV